MRMANGRAHEPDCPARRSTLRASLCVLLGLTVPSTWAGTIVLRTASQEHALTKYDPANADAPGICFEIARAIEKTDPDLSFTGFNTPLPLPRILALMKAGQLDVFVGAFHIRERESQADYLPQPLYTINHRVAVRIDDPIDVADMDALRKLAADNPVMTMQGTAYESFLRQAGIGNVDVGTTDMNVLMKKLLNGRGRFVYESDMNLAEAIRKFHLQDKVRILPASFRTEAQFVIVRKGLDRAAAAKLETALEQLAKSGELKRLFVRYTPK